MPITYACDGERVYGHSGGGQKLRMTRNNPRVCFEVDHLDDMRNWRSVIAQGTFQELHGAAAERALRLLAERIAPLATSETSRPAFGDHGGVPGTSAVIFRIALSERTGRFERG